MKPSAAKNKSKLVDKTFQIPSSSTSGGFIIFIAMETSKYETEHKCVQLSLAFQRVCFFFLFFFLFLSIPGIADQVRQSHKAQHIITCQPEPANSFPARHSVPGTRFLPMENQSNPE